MSFWREERPLPDYPGAWVRANYVGNAVRHARVKGDDQPWLTTASVASWKSDEELLEWLGPDWVEESTPPVRWVPVEPRDIEVGDYVRCERSGGRLEGEVIQVRADTGLIITDEWYRLVSNLSCTWFKREGGESDE